MAEDTVNNNGVTCNGLNAHLVITVYTVRAVGTVDGEDVAGIVGDLHVTVGGVVNLGDNAGNDDLVRGVGVVLHRSTGVDSILNRGGSGEGHDPTILNLRSAVVLTNDTHNNNVVTCNGLNFHSVVTVYAVCAVGAVNGEDVAELVGDLHVTVGGVVNLGNDTCNEVLAFGVNIVIHGESHVNDFLDGGSGFGELNGKGLVNAYFAARSGNGNGNFNCAFRNDNSHLAVSNSDCISVGCPGKSNFRIYAGGEFNNFVSGEGGADLDLIENVSNLFSIGLNNQFEVLEAINTHRNEVRSAAVQNENTGCVCLPTEVSFVSCIDGSLVICLQSGGEVSNVCTNVGIDFTDLELEVIRGAAKLLTCDFNVLHNYGETYVASERFACDNLIGDIKNFNSLLVAVNDSCGTALDLLHTIVRSYGTGNFNGHTNFDAEISNGVFFHLVGVVTANYLSISEEEVVAGVACSLGVDSNNNTLNNNGIVFFSSHVLLVAPKNVLRNGEVECLGSGFAIGRGDGCSQNVCEFFCGFFINVYSVGVIIFLCDGNLVGVNSPGNGVFCIFDSNYSSYVEVCTGDALVLIKVVNISNSSIDVICGGSGGVVFSSGCFSAEAGDN